MAISRARSLAHLHLLVGSSAPSVTMDATSSSSSSAWVRRRRAESALWRAIASNQVETDERAWNEAKIPLQ